MNSITDDSKYNYKDMRGYLSLFVCWRFAGGPGKLQCIVTLKCMKISFKIRLE